MINSKIKVQKYVCEIILLKGNFVHAVIYRQAFAA